MEFKDIRRMSQSQIIHERKLLEKKYTTIVVESTNNTLPIKNNRVLSVSPRAFYHVTNKSGNNTDMMNQQHMNERAHFGLRKEIEKEVFSLFCSVKLKNCIFYEFKDTMVSMTHEEINTWVSRHRKSYMIYNDMKQINKHQYNRLMKLFRRWSELSIQEHYKVTGYLKRKNKEKY